MHRNPVRPRGRALVGALALMALLVMACGQDAPPSAEQPAGQDGAQPQDEPTVSGQDDGDAAAPASSEAIGEQASPAAVEGLDAACQDLYGGATISFVVPYSAGGGFDTYARMVAPYVEQQLDATIVVENEPGAGGLLAINNLLTKEGDSNTIAMMNGVGSGGAVIAGAEGAAFELDQLTYVARLTTQSIVMVTAPEGPYQTIDDVIAAEGFRFASSGPGGSDYVTPSVLIDVLGLDAEIVTGFDGSSETELAVIRGDVEAMTGDVDSRLPAIRNGEQKALLAFTRERVEELPDVPAIAELEDRLDEEARQIVSAHIALSEFGRPVVAPPGVPQENLTCLRDAFSLAVQDEELLRESEETSRPIDFLDGAGLEELVEELAQPPAAYEAVLRAAY